jgi:hypothetical protein
VADPTAPLTRQIPFSSLLSSIAKVVEKSNGFEKLQIDESPCSGSPARVHFTIFNTSTCSRSADFWRRRLRRQRPTL